MPDFDQNELSDDELTRLVERVFAPAADERRLAVLVDLPDGALADDEDWAARRRLGADWARRLGATDADDGDGDGGFETALVLYRNVRTNNAELPPSAWLHDPGAPLPDDADRLDPAAATSLEQILRRYPLVLAPTELSATAPLKLMAPRLGLRAATLPGFRPAMIPALRLDYREVDRQVRALAARLDDAAGAELTFAVDGEELRLFLDLRHRRGHASGGLLEHPGSAGNLPSGEAYIVPYEGERAGDPSRSEGVLPVQLDDEVVRFRIVANVAVEVEGDGTRAREQRALLAREPAYGNLAELGLGVLAGFGIKPIGETLLDEKLGLHVAFGRSDHFGGQVGPDRFSRPEAVTHLDWVYRPETQPRISVPAVDLVAPDGARTPLMRDFRYVVEL